MIYCYKDSKYDIDKFRDFIEPELSEKYNSFTYYEFLFDFPELCFYVD